MEVAKRLVKDALLGNPAILGDPGILKRQDHINKALIRHGADVYFVKSIVNI